jgi:hypothetical protein
LAPQVERLHAFYLANEAARMAASHPMQVCNFAPHGSESRSCSPAHIQGNVTLIVYEYPFNERIRTLLRLEDLYEKFKFFVRQEHPMQHHVALSTIFDMLEVAGRADLKSDLLQELERQKQSLLAYRSNPNVQAEALDAILANSTRSAAPSSRPRARPARTCATTSG